MKIAAPTLIMAMIILALAVVACVEDLQGERIAFTVSGAPSRDTALGMGGNVDIYAMNPDGSGVRRLTKNPAYDWNPVWSPDGQRIAFVSERDGNSQIYAMNADGSDMARLTNNDVSDLNPVWSPDGQRIAFVSEYYDDIGRVAASEIYAMNADGTEITRLVNDVARRTIPAWSPDGRRIAFASIRDGNADIYAVNADGSGITRLTDHDADDLQPAWSPDGRRIAFVTDRDVVRPTTPSASEIYSMNADGSDLTRLTNNDLVDWNPVWSPDSQRIAFSSSHGHGHSSIWTMNADGSETTQFFGGHSPVWSPDGQRIAFIDYPGYGDIINGDYEIYVMNADGSGVTQLTDNDVNDFYMSWRPAP